MPLKPRLLMETVPPRSDAQCPPGIPPHHFPAPKRKFNFVEYPPESKKLPSGKEIVKMMEEREAKRRIAAARGGVDAHLAAAAAAKRVSRGGCSSMTHFATIVC